ncbi:hypothetical protein [Mumia quercus]|uniref:hypothetical protein n=1 Tax=Mumia quercus TaxID=2976125 RepID=UPI0021D05212|nr:hypothetical protein [Mumia quercus]
MTAKKTDETDEETHVLSGVSSSQVVGGALAAMTAAVAGSWLGVAGTLIGAAVGSVVATIAGTVYTNSLRKSRRLAEAARLTTRAALANRAVTPGRPTVVMPTAPDAAQALAEAESEGADVGADGTDEGTPADKPKRLVPWRAAAVAAVVSLALALGGIWAYEKVAGHPIGSSDKPGTTFSNVRSGDSDGSDGSGGSGGSDDQDPKDSPSEQQSPSDTPSPTTPSRDTGSTPAPEQSTTTPPTPTPSPTTSPEPVEPTPPPIREDAEGLAPEQPAPQAETASPTSDG